VVTLVHVVTGTGAALGVLVMVFGLLVTVMFVVMFLGRSQAGGGQAGGEEGSQQIFMVHVRSLR
jgi:hypothetical protein